MGQILALNTSPNNVTQLLDRWQSGDAGALAMLTPLVYDELHQLARSAFKKERRQITLQPTVLINEVYLQLVDASVDWQSRSHFFCLAARMMRRILVNHAKARSAQKRGGDAPHVTLHENDLVDTTAPVDMLALEEALQGLEHKNTQDAEIVTLHYFGGLSYKEIAFELDTSEATVKRRLRFAKAWLRQQLEDGRDKPHE